MSLTWWSASFVVHSRSGTVHRDKERAVLRVGSCSEKIMSPTPVPEGCSVDAQAFSVFFLRAVVQPSLLLRVVYKRFGRSSCRPSTTFARCLTCQEMHMSIRLESSFQHCLVTLHRDHGLCSRKDAWLFLLKRPRLT